MTMLKRTFHAAHDVIREWLPDFESALLIFDDGGGYRSFLGADAGSGAALGELCDEQFAFEESLVMSPGIADLANLAQCCPHRRA